MRTALIGHTGFVGGNLLRQGRWDELYNRSNVADLAGRSLDLVVSAGAPAVKWLANKEPEADWAALQALMRVLGEVKAREFVLISTVDVYPVPIEVDEDTVLDRRTGQPYGRHRLLLEDFVRQRFERSTIVRLPGLFGPGLKKNAIYDLLHDNRVDAIHQDGVFQFYDLATILADVEAARRAGLGLVNFATEPVSVREVAHEAFGIEFKNALPPPAPRYDFRTRHAAVFGGSGPYMRTRRQVLDALRRFVDSERAARS